MAVRGSAIAGHARAGVHATALPPLRVRTLGLFAVWRGDEPIPPAGWSRRMVAALFKSLLGAPEHRLTREQAMDLLWPDVDPDRAATSLRVTVHRLRAVLDPPGATASYLHTDGAGLALAPAGTGTAEHGWLDATGFASAVATALAGRDTAACWSALTLYGGEYLPDDPYEEWALIRREELRAQYHALLLHLARLSVESGDGAPATRLLRTLLAADPCQEEAARLLIQLLAANGERAAALRVYDVLARALRDDFDVEPAPETVAERAALLSMRAEGQADAVPSPRRERTNLPAALTSFVGRGREMAALEHLLARGPAACRLLTLVGMGGSGKTRLALQVAAGLQPACPDGVWLIELAALSDPARVPDVIAAALDVRETPGQPLLSTLTDYLQPRRLLLVLDNCEHLVAACARVATTLLRRCPALQILATSREALGIAGETLWRVPPLTLPTPIDSIRAADRLDTLRHVESVSLFLERARASRPDFTLSPLNAMAVAQICGRLDGLPLAIELAAARLSVLSIHDLVARLDRSLHLLTTGNRAAPARHHTLRAVLDWSYDLLSPAEQALLRRLSVFAGGWTLAAAEAVCVDGPSEHGARVRRDDVLDLLAGLEAKSWVLLVAQDGESRYGILETVRQYAAERLEAGVDVPGEYATVRRTHAYYFLALVEAAEPELKGDQQVTWLSRLQAEHDNLRAALAWARQGDGDALAVDRRERHDLGLRLVAALWRFWYVRGYLAEGRQWLEDVLTQRTQGRQAEIVAGAGTGTKETLESKRTEDEDRPSIESTKEDGATAPEMVSDGMVRVRALNGAAALAHMQGDDGRAAALYDESLAMSRRMNSTRGMADALTGLGTVAHAAGAYEQATRLHWQSLSLLQEMGDRKGVAIALNNLGLVAQLQGSYAEATRLHEESLALKRELGYPHGISTSLHNLGEVALAQGAYERAREYFAASLRLRWELRNREGMSASLDGLAAVACAHGQLERAAQLLGATAALRASIGVPEQSALRPRYKPTLIAARAALGDDGFETAWAVGRALPLEQVVISALAGGGSLETPAI